MSKHMTLSELVSKQEELQSHLPYGLPNRQQIWCAQTAEVGEIIQAVKWGCEDTPKWCWWVRKDMTPSTKENLVSEFLDLLHFVLLEVVMDKSFTSVNDVNYENYWSESPYGYGPEVAVEYFSRLVDRYNHGQSKLMHFIRAAQSLNVSREEIDGNFEKSYNKNVTRWEEAKKAV